MVLSTFLIPLVLCTFTMALFSARQPEEKVFQYVFAVFCIFLVSTCTIFILAFIEENRKTTKVMLSCVAVQYMHMTFFSLARHANLLNQKAGKLNMRISFNKFMYIIF